MTRVCSVWIFMDYGMVCFLVTPTNGCLPKYLLLLQREGALFVEETKMNLEALQSPVCFEIVLEPVQNSCGHLFCKRCVEGVDGCRVCCEQFTSAKR